MESICRGWASSGPLDGGISSSGRGNSSERWVRLGHVNNISDGEGWEIVGHVSL